MRSFRRLLAVCAAAALATTGCSGPEEGDDPDRRTSLNTEHPASYRGVALHPWRRRDEIRPLDSPRFESNPARVELADDDPVLGVVRNGIARAYPLWILARQEIVNDAIGGEPVCVTYCPLSASAVVFDRVVNGRALTFGNAGVLYECNLVLYDRETESHWYQLRGVSIAGDLLETELRRLPVVIERWSEWRRAHPGTEVLTGDRNLGLFFRALGREPDDPEAPEAPVSILDPALPPMRRVLGFRHAATDYCVPMDRPFASGTYPMPGVPVTVAVTGTQAPRFHDPDGQELIVTRAYWFAWKAAFPSTVVLAAPASDLERALPE